MPKYKTEAIVSTLAAAIADGLAAVEELAAEMGEWRDNTEDKLGHTEKWERVSEAADALENIASELSDVEAPDGLGERAVTWTIMVPYKGRSWPRWMRAANAAAALGAAVDSLQAVMAERRHTIDEDDRRLLADMRKLLREIETNGGKCTEGRKSNRKELRRCLSVAQVQEATRDSIDDWETLCDTLCEQAAELENIEFPGMYG